MCKGCTYLKNVLIGIDQLVNTLLGGYPDETMSARAYRLEYNGKLIGKILRPIIDCIMFWDDNHCKESYESEVLKKQLPKDYDV